LAAGDIEVVARAAARGDRDAFATLCATLSDDIWRYCYALCGDRELAFEAAQETFLRAVKAIRRFRGDGPVKVYLIVIARRAVAEVLRRERGRGDILGDPPEQVQPDATGLVDTEDLLALLPIDLRQAFVLTQVIGLPYEETARIVGCPIGTVRSRVFRARERLVAALNPEDSEEPDAQEG
jgi:RNA polymerase sigma-70 factor, ECF subfamily